MRRDLFGGFAAEAQRWSAGDLARQAANGLAAAVQTWPRAAVVSAAESMAPLYAVTWDRGQMRIERGGLPFATLDLEPVEQWDLGQATKNPTGVLEDAPAGALRILFVCSLGLSTGVELRLRAEAILRAWRVDAWLEVRGIFEAAASAAFADVVIAAADEGPAARRLCCPRQLIVIGNEADPAELRHELAGIPAIAAERSARTR